MNPLHRFVFRFLRWNRVASLLLAICLLSSSTPAAPQAIVAIAREQRISFAFWYHSSGLAKIIQGRGAPSRRAQERQADRDTKVVRLEIHPSNVSVDLAERVRFVAVGYDGAGNAVGGVKVRWTAEASTAGRRTRISRQGEFHPVAPGVFTVTAQAAGRSAQTTVTVRPGVRPNLNLPPTGTRQVSSRDVPTVRVGSNKQQKNAEKGSTKSSQRPAKTDVAKRSHALKTALNANPEPMPQGGGGGWDSSNYWSADDPGNRVGDPPGTTPDGGSGSGNFQFAAPIYSAPGRGINISLGLAYNSRVWNKAGTQMSFDNDRGWPAPGFNLGFGKLLGMTINTGCMLVDPDGTRHSYSGNITFYNWGTYGVMHTTDGSFIDYTYWTGTNGVITSAQAKLPNGTVINYGAYSQAGGGVFPTSIEDANGNFIYITYVNNAGPRIQTVSDTLGRVINFHYDSNNLLTAVTAPGLDGGTRTLVRLHYSQLTLSYGFSWPQIQSTVVSNPSPWVLDAIYYPGTGTGYWLNDSDSYSTYGMIRKVSERRNMAFSGPEPVPLNQGPTEQGTITSAGSVTREALYSYPLTPDYSVTDAPTYPTMTERWTPDGSASLSEAVTIYEVHENASPRTTTVTLPNGTKNKRYSYNSPGSFLDGLVYRDVTFTTDENHPLQSSDAFWQEGAYDSPRPYRVQKTDERGQMTAAEFSYGSVYNQVTDIRDLGYDGELLRSTRTTYQNSASYTGTCYSYGCYGRHIFNLPLNVEVYAGDNFTRVSRTEYQYDGQPLTATPNVVMHNQASNPHAEAEGFCHWETDWNDPDCNGSCWEPGWNNCDGQCNQIYICPYDASTDYRGNVTQITSYADASNLTGAVTETRRYDTTGNLVKASTSCCEQTTFTYTVDTQYAYLESETRGSASDPYHQVTTSATYDFDTGLSLSTTDADGRTAQTSYFTETLRPQTISLASGAHTDFTYDDTAMTVSETTYLQSHPTHTTIADQNVKYLNGNGQVRQEEARGPDNGPNQTWDAMEIVFNNLGQVIQQSGAYRLGSQTPVFSTATYDALGRTTRSTAPDGSVTEVYYDEIDFDPNDGYVPQRPDAASSAPGETTIVRDAWGRELWSRSDAEGRLVEVVEPNPNGNGSVASGGLVTTYGYDTLGNLIQINQGQQTRSFAYDSLGRLTAQKLAEVSATLNSAGNFLGVGQPGAEWGDVFTYDERSNVTARTDARGIKTVYSYNNDPLNRLQSVSWDTSGFGDTANPILTAPTVTYQYRQKTLGSQLLDITDLSSITTTGVSTDSYGYDSEGRVNSKTLTLTTRPNHPFVTDYMYDAFDRVTDVIYPKQWGNGQQPRKQVHHDYDIASRLSGLTYDGQSFASNISYNAASQTTSLKVGPAGVNQITENYDYDSQTGLLSNQNVIRGTDTQNPLLDLSYDYANASGKRTGQLTKILNNLNPNKNRGYSYDALGRLVQASGGVNGSLWTQTYSYDRYGNRTSVTASGYSAKSETTSGQTSPLTASATRRRSVDMSESLIVNSVRPPSEPSVDLPTDLLARKNAVELRPFLRDDPESISDSPPKLFSDKSSRPNSSASPPPPRPTPQPTPTVVPTPSPVATPLDDLARDSSGTHTTLLASNFLSRLFAPFFGVGQLRSNLIEPISDSPSRLWSSAASTDPSAPDFSEVSSASAAASLTLPVLQASPETYRASTDFSTSQGYRNWFYLDGNGAQMTWDANGWWQGPETYLRLWSTGDHPGNYIDSVRQWRAPSSGSIRITGTAYDHNAGCGDGVVVSIRRGTQVFWQHTIENGNATGFSYDITMNVAVGDPINFVVNGRSACWCDGTTFDPTITLTRSASSTYQAYTDYSNVQGQRNWYYLDSNGNQMTWNGWSWQGPETYLLLEPANDHPGNYIDSVRQWRAPSSGSIRITGTAYDQNAGCGDGVIVSIKHGTELLWQQTINNGNATGFSYDLTRTVAAGDQINFVTNGRSACWCDGTSFNSTIVLTPPDHTPFTGTPISLPGTIQVEDFDNGSEGFAYHDTTPGNAGGQYRANTDVDVGGNSAGYNVGWTISGEWVKYSVNVATTDIYTIEAIVSGVYCCPNMHVEIDGVNVTGPMSVPNTGAWGAWQPIYKTGVSISAGLHVVTLAIDTPDGFLIDGIRIVPPPPTAPSSLNAAAVSASQINISWADASHNETGFKVERKAGASGTWSQVATPAANATTYSDTGLQSSTTYYYRIRATNLGGDSAYSNEANATTLNALPAVNITSPANTATFANDSTIEITATASDDVAVTKVEFFQGGNTKLGEDTNGGDGYTLSWTNVFAGSYQLTAKATDNVGATTTSSIVNVTVTLPVVTITAIDSAAAEAGSDTGTITVSRTGGTSAALVVNFSVTGTATSGNDYSAVGSSTTIPAGSVSRTIAITPVDDTEVESSESVIVTLGTNSSYTVGNPLNATVNITDNDTHPPIVTLTAPTAGAVFTAPANITVTANATDSDGTISRVDFYQGTILLGTDTTAPYSFAWNNVAAGSYSLTAKATDNLGATTTSAVVNINVNALPTVSVDSPVNGATFTAPANITINANASDADGTVSTVEFYQGTTLLGTDTSAPYSVNWDNVTSGSYSLTARVTDNHGATTTSSAVNITVNANGAPSVNITSPANGASFTAPANITVTANATDSDGTINRVDFYNGTNLIGSDATAPYSANWNNVAAGSHSLSAKAIDSGGAETNSTPISITVNPALVPIPLDGHSALSYDIASNRTTTAGFAYDAAGNQTRAQSGDGWQRFQYDAANRLVKVKNDSNVTLVTYTYGPDNRRLISQEENEGSYTYYVSHGNAVIAEYREAPGSPSVPQWSKSYIYLGSRLLSTLTSNGSSGETIEYHHPDRLGTRLVTNPSTGTWFEQVSLPFGTPLDSESSGATNRRFTSYDRSATTRLDYAVNRHYDSQQGRFTQVDPIGAGAADVNNPQSWNMYTYVGNDPVNHTDPSGLFFKKFFKWVSKILKWVAIAAMVATVVISVVGMAIGAAALKAFLTTTLLGKALSFVASIPTLIGNFISGLPQALAGIFGFAETGSAIIAGIIGNAVLIGGSAAAGAVADHLEKKETGKGRRRREKAERRRQRETRPRRLPPVRLPPNLPEIRTEPQQGKPEVRVPPKPELPRIDPNKPRLPENATRGQKIRFGIAQVLKGLGQFIRNSTIVIMVDPAVIAEIACQENPSSDTCQQFLIFIPPEKRCKILRCV